MSHAVDPAELREVPGDKRRAIVQDDVGLLAGEPFATALDNHLHLGFLHVRADLAVNDGPTVPVEDAAKEEESPIDMYGGNINVPVLMSSQ